MTINHSILVLLILHLPDTSFTSLPGHNITSANVIHVLPNVQIQFRTFKVCIKANTFLKVEYYSWKPYRRKFDFQMFVTESSFNNRLKSGGCQPDYLTLPLKLRLAVTHCKEAHKWAKLWGIQDVSTQWTSTLCKSLSTCFVNDFRGNKVFVPYQCLTLYPTSFLPLNFGACLSLYGMLNFVLKPNAPSRGNNKNLLSGAN